MLCWSLFYVQSIVHCRNTCFNLISAMAPKHGVATHSDCTLFIVMETHIRYLLQNRGRAKLVMCWQAWTQLPWTPVRYCRTSRGRSSVAVHVASAPISSRCAASWALHGAGLPHPTSSVQLTLSSRQSTCTGMSLGSTASMPLTAAVRTHPEPCSLCDTRSQPSCTLACPLERSAGLTAPPMHSFSTRFAAA